MSSLFRGGTHALLLSAALILFACETRAPVRLPATDAKELAQSLVSRAIPFSAKGRIRFGASFGFAEAQILVDPREGMRIDAYSPFMTPLSSLVLKPPRGQYFDSAEALLVRGPARKLILTFFGVDVDPSPLPWILAGGIPNASSWEYSPRHEEAPPDSTTLRAVRADSSVLFAVLAGEEHRLLGLYIHGGPKEGSPILCRFECSRHKIVGVAGVPLPGRVEVRGMADGETLILKLWDFQPGKGPSPEELILEAQPGVREYDIR